MAFLIASIYHDLGSKNPDFDITNVKQLMGSWLGLVFFCSIDQFVSMSFAQILQLPMIKPVYYREKKGNLYSASAYFFSTLLCSMGTLLFYPLSVGLFSFYFIKFDDDSTENLFRWLSVLVLI